MDNREKNGKQMTFNPGIHHRHSLRLQGYDYSQTGAYFITICTQNRECLFGEIVDDEMILNDAGKMIATVWNEIPAFYPGINVDTFQIMPNHIHGIIMIVGADPRVCLDSYASPGINNEPRNNGQPQENGQAQGPAPTLTMPDIVQRYKTMTTKRYTDGVKKSGWRTFNRKLWQRNYYEHVMRNDNELNRVREYILNNPINWFTDENNPVGAGPCACPNITD